MQSKSQDLNQLRKVKKVKLNQVLQNFNKISKTFYT